ncbi:MAG: FAD binding domain-containing protein [Nocardioides sp.]|nr:FAD binding domain-containing protein [Nocardioides sp.]
MVTASAYWRPATLAQAFELLARPGVVVLAGGTRLNGGSSAEQVEMVDLQALDLDGIRPEGGDAVRIGAMATLQEVADSDQVPGVLREAARREQPSTLRAQGTVGGCIATGHGESELLAALLVHEAVVHVDTSLGTEAVPLERLLDDLPLGAGRVVTALTIRTAGAAAAAHTARTPADRAIVAAFARTTDGGRRFALTGVAPTPVLVQPGDELHPVGDFRGSSDYRRALAEVLLARVVEGIA